MRPAAARGDGGGVGAAIRAESSSEQNQPDSVAPRLFVTGLAERAVREFFADGCPHLAASIAFRVLFSLFPLAIVLTAVFSLTSARFGFRPDVIDAVVRQVPLTDDGQRRLRDLLEQTAGVEAVGIVGLAGLVWAASGMMSAVRTALNLAWDAEDTRPWLIGKLVDVLFVFGTALVVTVSVVLGFSVRLAQELVTSVGVDGLVTTALVGSVVPFALSFLVTLVTYRFVPATSPRFRHVIGPALFVAAVFTLAQVLFAVYLEAFGRYDAIYGSFGAVIAFMLFVYLASLAFLLGAELAASTPRVLEDIRHGGADDEEAAPLTARVRRALKGLVVR